MPRLRTSTQLKLAYVALAAVDTWLSGSSRPAAHRVRLITKPLLMPTLAASLITNPDAVDSPLRAPTLAAQLGGWGGDLALLGDEPGNFEAGMALFGLGHAAYISGFVRNRDRSRPFYEVRHPRLVAALWASNAPVMAVAASRQDRALGPSLTAYSASLAAMVGTSSHLDPALPRSARRLTLAGSSLFLASDTILGARKFLMRNPPHRLESLVMATYTGAQLLLSEGAARAGR